MHLLETQARLASSLKLARCTSLNVKTLLCTYCRKPRARATVCCPQASAPTR
jgi:hypothetical protein